MTDIIKDAANEGMAAYNGVKTFSSEVRLRSGLEAAARRAIELSQAEPMVSAREVFRVAGGDIECSPSPTPAAALECLTDLRACYDESLSQKPAPLTSIRVDIEGIGECEIQVRDSVAFMPAVTVADIVSKSCLVPRAALAPVGYVDPVQLEELKRGECAAIQFGTESRRYHRTLPLYAAPHLNEPFGNPEELPLNEPSGKPGQLASREQRARELLPVFRAEMEAAYGYTPDVYSGVLTNGRDADRFDGWMLARSLTPDTNAALAEWHRLEGHQPDLVRMKAAITAALSAQPRAMEVPGNIALGETIYTPPGEEVRFCYTRGQPNNVNAWRLGEACRQAADASAGDHIDRGLALLKALEERGYGVFRFAKDAAAQPRDDWEGSSAQISALPAKMRDWVMWLQTDADPAGTLQENWRLTQENAALRALMAAPQPREVRGVEELADRITDHLSEQEYDIGGRDELRRHIRDALTATTPQDAAGVEEMSPDFTDSARAAIAWVLYHHQGGSSPVGQPLRFALGMGADDPLPNWRIAEAKRYAEWAGASTERFHTTPPPGVDVGKLRELADTVVRDVCELDPADPEHPDTVTVRVNDLRLIVERSIDAAAPGVGNG